MSEFKIVWQCWLDVNSISRSTRKSTVTAYTVRFSPVWNPVMEGMITIRTLPTVCTQFIHSIFKPGPNVIIQNKVKITDMNKNNYYNTKLSDIQLAKSLWWLKRHNTYKEHEKMKYELICPQTSTSVSQVDSFWSVCNITHPLQAHTQLCIQLTHSRSR